MSHAAGIHIRNMVKISVDDKAGKDTAMAHVKHVVNTAFKLGSTYVFKRTIDGYEAYDPDLGKVWSGAIAGLIGSAPSLPEPIRVQLYELLNKRQREKTALMESGADQFYAICTIHEPLKSDLVGSQRGMLFVNNFVAVSGDRISESSLISDFNADEILLGDYFDMEVHDLMWRNLDAGNGWKKTHFSGKGISRKNPWDNFHDTYVNVELIRC